MKMNLRCILFACVLLGTSVIYAQDKEVPKVDNTIPEITLPPSPGEVLNALNKIGRVQWSSLVTYNKFYNYKGRNLQSLNLGIRVADAFVALHDQDKVNFGNMNNVIYSLSKELGISTIIKDQKNLLQDLSQKDDWVLLVIELNAMNAQLQEELYRQRDEDIVLLSNIGAFFEGIRIVSSHFMTNYDEEKVGLLQQIQLTYYYIGEIDKKYSSLKDDESVRIAYDGLVEIKDWLVKDPEVSYKTVEKIYKSSGNVVDSISK